MIGQVEAFAFAFLSFAQRKQRRTISLCRLVVNGRSALSAEMAIRFEKAFGLRADTLLRMQAAHDLAQARLHEDELKVSPLRIAA